MLNEIQKSKIRFYLGWSARFHQFDSALEQAMAAIDSEPDTETLILATLTAIEDIDTKLTGSHTRLKAMKIGSINLPGSNEVGMLRGEGRRHVGRLAATLGVPVRQDVFSSSKYNSSAGFDGLYGARNKVKYG